MVDDLSHRIERLEDSIASIQERNRRVEQDKKWETSGLRILSITIMTYGIVVFFLYLIGVQSFLLSAIVPAMAIFFLLSHFRSFDGGGKNVSSLIAL